MLEVTACAASAVLVDVQMPDRDGSERTALIRARTSSSTENQHGAYGRPGATWAGTIPNVVLLLAVAHGWFTEGPSSFRAQFDGTRPSVSHVLSRPQ
jgi:hypothetical protein